MTEDPEHFDARADAVLEWMPSQIAEFNAKAQRGRTAVWVLSVVAALRTILRLGR